MAERKQKQKKLSVLKRHKQSLKRYQSNKALRSALRTEFKKFNTNLEQAKDKDVSAIHSVIDKARSKGIISKNNASRKKSSAARAFLKTSSASSSTSSST